MERPSMRGHRGEVADFVGPQEDGAVEKVQVGARFEEEGSVRKRPCGTTTTPPPAAAAESMVAWMTAVFRVALSPMAPKEVMLNCGPWEDNSTAAVSLNQAGISDPSGRGRSLRWFAAAGVA
jgi:hypothetical protein